MGEAGGGRNEKWKEKRMVKMKKKGRRMTRKKRLEVFRRIDRKRKGGVGWKEDWRTMMMKRLIVLSGSG